MDAVHSPPSSIKAMRFSGTTADYFAIWLSNLLLSIVTLGIYSAWAKVRRKQYFYNHTYLDEYAFGYHATGMQILKGRLVVVAGFIILNICAQFYPLIYAILALILFFTFPFLINKSLEFNAKVTSYRNIRFKFKSDYWEAFITFQILPILTILSFGILAPVAVKKAFAYVYDNTSYGGVAVSSRLFYSDFYHVFGLVVVFPVMLLMSVVFMFQEPLFILAAVYLLFFLIFFIYRTCCLRLVFSSLRLGDKIQFSTSIHSGRLVWIEISNFLAIVCSFGLFIPWANVRKQHYLCDHIYTLTCTDFSQFIGQVQQQQSSIGEEFADFEGVELGL
jgi:uncharacterized membrane protein YjgN (DUF898 family)